MVCSNPTVDVRGALDSSVPVVLIDAAPESQRAALERGSVCAFVCSDNRESGRLAADELISGGCRSLALVSATRHDPVGTRRTESFETELGRRGLALDPRLVICPKATGFDEGYAATERLLAGDVPFDGMFCQTDRLAMGALEALREQPAVELHELVDIGTALAHGDAELREQLGRDVAAGISHDRAGRCRHAICGHGYFQYLLMVWSRSGPTVMIETRTPASCSRKSM